MVRMSPKRLFFACCCMSSVVLGAQPFPMREGKARLGAFEAHRRLREKSDFTRFHWQFLGPTNFSGRCTDIEAVRPRGESCTIYAASASGGVWKTVNEGNTWMPVFEDQPSTDIGDIAIDPNDPETIWVGTGEANIYRSSMAGCGIYRSEDGGETWEHRGLENSYTIARILVHPEDADVVYVAVSGAEWTENPERGVYRTRNGGDSWKQILCINERTGAIDLVMDPSDPRTLYAATWERIRKKWMDPRPRPDDTGSGLWKTTDGGEHWLPVNEGLPPAGFRGRIGIDICDAHPRVLYALLDNHEPAGLIPADENDNYGRPINQAIRGATVYRTDNGGATWKQASGRDPVMKAYMQKHSATYGWVFGQIRADPVDPWKVYSMGLALNLSLDGGKTFRQLEGMHGDHHGLWIDPGNTDYLLNANDGGVCVSRDGGENWNCWLDNLPAVQFYNVNFDLKDPFRVYGSIQDHGSCYGIVDLSRGRDRVPAVDFHWAPGGESCNHAIHPVETDLVFSAGFYGSLERTDMNTPGEDQWQEHMKPLLPVRLPGEAPFRGQWVAPFQLSTHNPDIIYHGMQYVLRSNDRGDTWEVISPDLSHNDPEKQGDISYQTISSLSESPLRFGLLYAGTDDGRVHRTMDGGKSWTDISGGLAPGKWISRVVASVHHVSTVYLCQNGKRDDDFQAYVWKSTDSGDTWQDLSAGIPLGPVNVIREDPREPDLIYLGTDIGVYLSTDGGRRFDVLGDLPSAYVHDLRIHPRDLMIVIATHGRGIWVMDAEPLMAE